jgi:hypothetical protein
MTAGKASDIEVADFLAWLKEAAGSRTARQHNRMKLRLKATRPTKGTRPSAL